MLMYREEAAYRRGGGAVRDRLLAVLTGVAKTTGSRLSRWIRRSRARQVLSALDEHQLRDVGLLTAGDDNWNERLDRLIGPRLDAGTIQRRALADLGESRLCDLSESGARAWRAAQREKRENRRN